MTGLAWDRRW